MRISELAALTGVTTRAVRHYHQLGLLPEPGRLPNGYRQYTVRDAVALARIRRLTELGLGLDEVRGVIADDAGNELAAVLRELDADLARQEARIAARRARLAALLVRAEHKPLSADDEFSPELADLYGALGTDTTGSAMASKDRELLTLMTTGAAPEERDLLLRAVRSTAAAPGAVERAHEVYALLDALADADPCDPRVDEAARALAACLPPDPDEAITAHPEARAHPGAGGQSGPPATTGPAGQSVLKAFLADLAPAQAEAVRRAMRSVATLTNGTTP
ncbi:MerR family transcriptional regulator [Streptomyces sp. NPDC006632]|uniref:MerR family transcriptional regulator n=1 Tax=Streptomyces sp. NPDC006632 TaxID=3157182 RepID=UPI0033AAACEC